MGDTEFKNWGPSFLKMTFNSPWSILRPTVFRFMDKIHVDKFFEDGSLRLSSFKKFSQHDDNERKDEFEGLAVSTLIGENTTAIYASKSGISCYVLCGSISYAPAVSDGFGQSAIVIEDTVNFAGATARALPGYRDGIEGLCTYQSGKRIRRKLPGSELDQVLEKHRLPDGNINMDMLREVAGHTAIEQMFLKDAKYAHQLEYRLLWDCTVVEDHIDIKIPEARQFCKRFDY